MGEGRDHQRHVSLLSPVAHTTFFIATIRPHFHTHKAINFTSPKKVFSCQHERAQGKDLFGKLP